MKITLVFLNNGTATANFGGVYAHFYDDMKQLADDVRTVLINGLDESEILRDWDNNEIAEWPDNFKACCAITEGNTNSDEGFTTLLDLDKAWGGNVARFLEAFDEIVK